MYVRACKAHYTTRKRKITILRTWSGPKIAAVAIVSAERLVCNSFRYQMFDATRARARARTPFSAAHLTDIKKIDQKCKSGFRWEERQREGGRESVREILWNENSFALLVTSQICRHSSKIKIR